MRLGVWVVGALLAFACGGDDAEAPGGGGGDDAGLATDGGGGGGRDMGVIGFGTGLPCFMFPAGAVDVPEGWGHRVPEGHVIGNAWMREPGTYTLAGATDMPATVLGEYVNDIFADHSPQTTAENTNNRVITFDDGMGTSGEVEAFSDSGGFEDGTCVRLIVDYTEPI
ncbi:MAG: hypothetical protein AAGH15_17265 [Myxococcota bacterium]